MDPNGLSQDAHGRWGQTLSATQVLTGQEEQNPVKTKAKGHGNRKLQRFKRKCRKRGLSEEAITTLIQTKHCPISEQPQNDSATNNNGIHTCKKRKRDLSSTNPLNKSIKSLSQLSISQENAKKMQKTTTTTTTDNTTSSDDTSHSKHFDAIQCNVHKFSRYLRMPRRSLLASLRLQLNHPLKKKKLQCFILSRLQVLDRQYCFERIHHLYQSYLILGSQYQIWPVTITDVGTDAVQMTLICALG